MRQITPSEVKGTLDAPYSKSIMQRALAAAALAKGASQIQNPSFCDDALAAMEACRALGAKVDMKKTGWSGVVLVQGIGGRPSRGGAIECGESGLCSRMFTPIAALSPSEFTITGKGSLLSRPMEMAEVPLRSLGVQVRSANGFLPLKVKGPLKGGEVEVDGSMSSQFLTGLLIALPLCENDSVVHVNDLKSKEYVSMTIDVVSVFGGKIENKDFSTFKIPGGQKYVAQNFSIEGDWSGSSALMVAGAIAGEVKVMGLNDSSHQPDRRIVEALKSAGAQVKAGQGYVEVKKARLRAFSFDATDCPDLFPALVALACYCRGKTVLKGAQRLRHKESDRAAALVQEFSKMGAIIRAQGDVIEVFGAGGGSSALAGGEVDSHNDHRIAMACAVAGLGSEKGVRVNGEGCVSKSFPGFFEALEGLRSRRK